LDLSILALGILSVVPVVRAAESPDVDANKGAIGEPFASLAFAGSENLTYGAVTESSNGEPSASELNRSSPTP